LEPELPLEGAEGFDPEEPEPEFWPHAGQAIIRASNPAMK
jgi:hypothetical protein